MTRALVVGGSSPIGAAIARNLAAQGCEVVVHANSQANAAEDVCKEIVAAGGAAAPFVMDLTKPGAAEAVAELASQTPIQVLAHCVGMQRDMPFAAMTRDDWSMVMDVNLNSIFTVLNPIILPMIRTRWARVVLISSLSAIAGNRGQTNYAAAKSGLHGFAKSLAREYGSRGLTANVVAPGLIDTPATRALPNFDQLAAMAPAKCAGTVDDVASLVGFLCSRQAGYISGQMICVDGGAI